MSTLSQNTQLFPASTVDPAGSIADRIRNAALQAEVLALFDELRDRLLRYSMSFGLAVQDGEDVLQEVFLALFRHLQADKSRENLPGWAYRTTHNLSLKRRAALHLEVRRTTPAAAGEPGSDPLQDYPDGVPGPEQQVLFRERQQRLQAVVQALPAKDRACLQLRAEGWRYRDIAVTVGISLGSVAASLARSFEKLRRIDAR